MVVRVQYLLDANRLLREDVTHLQGQHHCPLHTCESLPALFPDITFWRHRASTAKLHYSRIFVFTFKVFFPGGGWAMRNH